MAVLCRVACGVTDEDESADADATILQAGSMILMHQVSCLIFQNTCYFPLSTSKGNYYY